MIDYRQAYERLREATQRYLDALDEPMSDEAAGRIQQAEIRLRTELAAPLPSSCATTNRTYSACNTLFVAP